MAEWEYFYIDPELKSTSPDYWKRPQRPLDSEILRQGDIVEVWNHVFRWDEDCIPDSKMSQWCFRGDKLADAALPILTGPDGDAGGTDLLARLESAATKDKAAPEVTALWKQVHDTDTYRWPDEAQIERGQAVFWRYAPFILASLLHCGLAAGFASLRISRQLNMASYLAPPISNTPEGEAPRITKQSNDRSYQRLMETTQFTVDCMGKGAMNIGGSGWASTIRVRLLHTTMRRRLLQKIRKEWETKGYSPFNEKTDGVPLSQEDMAETLAAFGPVPLACLRKVGLTPTAQECEDYISLWRYIGYYLGIDSDILRCYHSNYHQSTRLLGCTLLNGLAGESDPPPPCQFPFQENLVPKQQLVTHLNHAKTNSDPYAAPLTLPVLLCICNRWPVPFNFPQHCAATRQLLGPTLSDWLSVPRTSWFDVLQMQLGYGLSSIPPRFARLYRPGWDLQRRIVMEQSVNSAVSMSLGLRHSKFRPRKPDQYKPTKEGDEFYGESRMKNLRLELIEWGQLYGEMAAVVLLALGVFMFFAPITVPVTVMWALWIGLVRRRNVSLL